MLQLDVFVDNVLINAIAFGSATAFNQLQLIAHCDSFCRDICKGWQKRPEKVSFDNTLRGDLASSLEEDLCGCLQGDQTTCALLPSNPFMAGVWSGHVTVLALGLPDVQAAVMTLRAVPTMSIICWFLSSS